MKAVILTAAAGCLHAASAAEERIALKTIRHEASTSDRTIPTGPSGRTPPTLTRQPRVFSGPSSLYSLTHSCFHGELNDYDYVVCPFANVTQRQKGSTWSGFWGVLGVWDAWEKNKTSDGSEYYTTQSYTDGTDCGGKARRTSVTLQCSGPWRTHALRGIAEPKTCEYTMTLMCPEACDVDWKVGFEGEPPFIPATPSPSPSTVSTSASSSSTATGTGTLHTKAATATATALGASSSTLPSVASAAVSSSASASPMYSPAPTPSSAASSSSGSSTASLLTPQELASTLLSVQKLLVELNSTVGRLVAEVSEDDAERDAQRAQLQLLLGRLGAVEAVTSGGGRSPPPSAAQGTQGAPVPGAGVELADSDEAEEIIGGDSEDRAVEPEHAHATGVTMDSGPATPTPGSGAVENPTQHARSSSTAMPSKGQSGRSKGSGKKKKE